MANGDVTGSEVFYVNPKEPSKPRNTAALQQGGRNFPAHIRACVLERGAAALLWIL